MSTLTINEMWGLINKSDNTFGIEGYNPLQVYHKNKEVKPNPTKDKDGNPIKFKRESYLDHVTL